MKPILIIGVIVVCSIIALTIGLSMDKILSNQNNLEIADEQTTQSSIYNLRSQNEIDTVQVDSSLDSQEVKIIGLYDPEDYDLTFRFYKTKLKLH